jgi:hypothetical protein
MIRVVRLQDVPATFYVGPAGIVVASALPEVAEIEAGKVWQQSQDKLSVIPAVLGDGTSGDFQSFTDEAAIKDYLYARQVLSDQEIQMVAGWLGNRIAPVPEIGERKKASDIHTRVEQVPAPEKVAGKLECLAGPAGIVVLGEDAQEAHELARQIWEKFDRKLAPVPAVLGQYSSVEGVRAFPDTAAITEYLNGADYLNAKEIAAVQDWLKDRSKPVPKISEKKKKPPVAEVKQTPPPDKVKAEPPAPPPDKKEVRLVAGPGGVILFGHDVAAVQAAAQQIYLNSAGTIVPVPAIKGKHSPAPGVMAFPDREAAKKYVQEGNEFSSEELNILRNWIENPGSPAPRLVRRPAQQAAVQTATPPPRPSPITRSRWHKVSQLLFWIMLAPFATQLGLLLFFAVADENVVLAAWFLAAFIRFWAFFARDAGSPVYWRWPFLIGGGAVDLWLGLYLLAPERPPHPWSDWQADPIFAAILLAMAAISVIRGIWGIIPGNRLHSLS